MCDWNDHKLKNVADVEKYLNDMKTKKKEIKNLEKKSYQNYEQRKYDNFDNFYANTQKA